jgi:hypothetical protein
MEQPKNHPSASEHQSAAEREEEERAGSTPEVAEKQIDRWKDDGGAVPPAPEPEPTREHEDQP